MTPGAERSDEGAAVVQRRRWVTGLLVAVGAASLVLPLAFNQSYLLGVAAVVLAGLTVVAFTFRAPAAVRALVFFDVAFLVLAAGGLGSWPSAVSVPLVCLAPLAALLVCNRAPGLRPAAPWLRSGRLTAGTAALGVAAVVLAGVVLTLWAAAVRPEPAPFLRGLQQLPWWMGIAGVAGFALVNSIWEEALYRGVVLEELTATWGPTAAVVTQAIVFGAAHWAGFPSGWFGVCAATAWGLALGIIRLRSGGILIPYLVHVCVDAVIGLLALLLLH